VSGGGGGVIIIRRSIRSILQTETLRSGLSPASCAKAEELAAKAEGDWARVDVRKALKLINKADAELAE
jgi:hypothetical protein